MSDQDKKADAVAGGNEVGGGEAAQDPKNVAELTHYIQNMLQQMQDRLDVHPDGLTRHSCNILGGF